MPFFLYVSLTACKKIAILAVLICALLPSFSFAATLGFSPRERTYEVGSTITVAVVANSGGSALNAVSGTVSFPKELLQVQSVTKSDSVMSLWVQEPTFSNQNGAVQFEGIVLNPGYTGTNGTVLTVTFKALRAGVATLSFPNGSILANDGEGSEILSSRGSAVFTFTDRSVEEEIGMTAPSSIPTLEETGTAVGPLVRQNNVSVAGWTNKTTQTFLFEYGPEVTALRLLVDSNSDSLPTVLYEPPISLKEIVDIPTGISYLHVQTKSADGWGAVTHHTISLDTDVPETLTVLEQKNPDKNSRVKVFTLQAHDSSSGIERFEVALDGASAEVLTAGEYVTYITPVLTSGAHTLIARSFDKAGNFTEKTTEFTIAEDVLLSDETKGEGVNFSVMKLISSGAPAITIVSVVVPTLALVLVLCGLLFFGLRQYKKYKSNVSAEVTEAKEVTKRVFALIKKDLDSDILMLEKASKKRKLTKEEEKLLKHIKQNIAGAEKVISDELQDIAR